MIPKEAVAFGETFVEALRNDDPAAAFEAAAGALRIMLEAEVVDMAWMYDDIPARLEEVTTSLVDFSGQP